MNTPVKNIVDAIIDVVLGTLPVEEQERELTRIVSSIAQQPVTSPFPIVVLCGSMTRFYSVMLDLAQRLTREGCIVLSPFVTKTTIHDDTYNREKSDMLDRMHLVKIDMSSEVLIVDCTFDLEHFEQYIGESTSLEIAYALKNGKRVTYLSTLIRLGYNAIVESGKAHNA